MNFKNMQQMCSKFRNLRTLKIQQSWKIQLQYFCVKFSCNVKICVSKTTIVSIFAKLANFVKQLLENQQSWKFSKFGKFCCNIVNTSYFVSIFGKLANFVSYFCIIFCINFLYQFLQSKQIFVPIYVYKKYLFQFMCIRNICSNLCV